jgi:YbbR domain-containing protein
MRKRFFGWIWNNIGIKISCLLLAIFLWLYVNSETSVIKNFHIPITIETLPDMEVTYVSVKSVFISVKGDRDIVLKAKSTDFALILDMHQEKKPGTYTREISMEDIKTPSDMDIIYIVPSSVTITLKKKQ